MIWTDIKNAGLRFKKISEVESLPFGLIKITATVLALFCLLTGLKQYSGDPIRCHWGKDVSDTDMKTEFCWIQGKYVIPNHSCAEREGSNEALECTDPKHVYNDDPQARTYVNYYMWIWAIFFFQSFLCLIPYQLWRLLEGGRIREYLAWMYADPKDADEVHSASVNKIAKHVLRRFHAHNRYALAYLFCEMLVFLIVLAQAYAMNSFLDYQFFEFGRSFWRHGGGDPIGRGDASSGRIGERAWENYPGEKIFPLMTQCSWQQFGKSGSVASIHALCLLPQNIFNAWIFALVWLWFIVLGTLVLLCVIRDILLIFNKTIRKFVLRWIYGSKANLCNMRAVAESAHFGDWFVLFCLADSLESFNFNRVLNEMGRLLNAKEVEPGQPNFVSGIESGGSGPVTVNTQSTSYLVKDGIDGPQKFVVGGGCGNGSAASGASDGSAASGASGCGCGNGSAASGASDGTPPPRYVSPYASNEAAPNNGHDGGAGNGLKNRAPHQDRLLEHDV